MFVSLLGSPRITLDGSPVEGLRRKNRALVYYLAAHREALTRDQLLAFFWPDEERPAAQQILRSMLHDLRKTLGEQYLEIAEDRLGLAAGVQVDARRLDAALSAPGADPTALAAALELYRGDFLDGFTLAATPAFDDWILTEREAYHAQAVRGFGRLARLHEARGDLPAALAALARALAIDPLREEVQRESLRLRCLSGDRAGAIRQYEALRKLLDAELGVPPMPETRALYDAIITDTLPGPASAAPPPLSRPPLPAVVDAKREGKEKGENIRFFTVKRRKKPANHLIYSPSPSGKGAGGVGPRNSVAIADRGNDPALALRAPTGEATGVQGALPFTGREQELAALAGLSAAQKFILVEGAPGIGKTRLVDEFIAAHLAGSHTQVLRGVAHEMEQGLPYQPMVDALRGLLTRPAWPALLAGLDLAPIWLAELARLLPELASQVAGLPAVPQQMDESRVWEAILQFLQALARLRRVALVLEDLHWADASSLGLIAYLARRAAGPALLLIGTTRPAEPHDRLARLVSSLAYEQRLVTLPLAPLSPADTLAVARRLSPAQYEPLSRWLAGSAEGNPFFLTELIRYARQTDTLRRDGSFDAARQLLPPTVQNLILSRLMRLSEGARRALEAAAVIGREFDALLLARMFSPPDTALSEAGLLDALDELQAVGLIQPRGGERFSFDHSLTMDVVLHDMGELRARRLHRQAGQALEQLHAGRLAPIAGLIAQHYAKSGAPERAAPFDLLAGNFAAGLAAWEEAIAFYEQALAAAAQPEGRSAAWVALGTARFHKGDFAQATAAFQSAIDLSGARGDLASLEAAYMGLNLSLLPQSRFAEAIALGRDLARSGPPELAICAHFIWASGLSVESAHPDEAEAHLREVQRLLDERSAYAGLVSRAHVSYQLAGVVGQQGHSAQAVSLYREALELVQRDETALDLLRHIMLYNNLAYHLHLLGDPAAAGYAQAGIKLARERGSLTHMPYLLSTSGEIALASGDLDQAEAFFSEGLRLAEQAPIAERIAGLTANLGLVARQRGLPDLARQRLSAALELADRLGSRHLAVRIRCWLAPLLPPDEARARLAEAQSLAQESGFHQLFEEIASLEQALS